MERHISEHKDHDDGRIRELYDSRNTSDKDIITLTATVNNIKEVVDEMKLALNEFMKEMCDK